MGVALVTGIAGQDGHYLAEYLHARGMTVWGVSRSGEIPRSLPFVRPAPTVDLHDQTALDRAVEAISPDEVYHLAAQSSVERSWADPVGTGDVTGICTVRLLEAVRRSARTARVFVASSSEIFGEPDHGPQDELTPIQPTSPYGSAKAYAHHMARIYRQHHGLFVAVGILYNHESPRRPPFFVTRKIVRAAVAIAQQKQTELRLGNLEARRDWGFAGDYVRAMHLMLQRDEPDEFVIATGESHSVRDVCRLAFARAGLDYAPYVVSDASLWRPAEPVPLVGNYAKARALLGWSPTVSFDQLIDLLVDGEPQVGHPTVGQLGFASRT